MKSDQNTSDLRRLTFKKSPKTTIPLGSDNMNASRPGCSQGAFLLASPQARQKPRFVTQSKLASLVQHLDGKSAHSSGTGSHKALEH